MFIRNKCVICSGKLKYILILKNYPVYMGVFSDENFLLENQTWCGCENCDCIQLKKLLPLKLVYKKFHHEIEEILGKNITKILKIFY